MTSKRAASPSSTWPALNSGLMPMRALFMSTGSEMVRSMVRPPDSRSRTMTSASSGRLVLAIAGSSTMTSALPSAPVTGSFSSGLRTGLICSSARPNLKPAKPGTSPLAGLTDDLALDVEAGGGRTVEVAARRP